MPPKSKETADSVAPAIKPVVQQDNHINNYSENKKKEENPKVHREEDEEDKEEEGSKLKVRKFERMLVLKNLKKTEYRAVAHRTRSHYSVKPRYKDFKSGTHSCPIIVSDDSDSEIYMSKPVTKHESKGKSICTKSLVDSSGDKPESKGKSNCTTSFVDFSTNKPDCAQSKGTSNCTSFVDCSSDNPGPGDENDKSNCNSSSTEYFSDDSDYSYNGGL